MRVAAGGKGGGKGGRSRSASEWSARFAVLSEVLFVPGAEPRLSAPGLARYSRDFAEIAERWPRLSIPAWRAETAPRRWAHWLQWLSTPPPVCG